MTVRGEDARESSSAPESAVKEPLIRFSVAIGGELLKRFDRYREEHQHPNRSEAVRGLMRDALIEEDIARDESPAMGVVTLVYDHHAGRVAERLTEIQHQDVDRVVTTTHVHLDTDRCLEVILLRGPARVVRELADSLIGTKGVATGRLVLTSTSPLPDRHEDPHAHDHGHSHSHPHPHPHTHEHPAPGKKRKTKREPHD
jgi:CopG family nickel-responsive transcriptional regulator